MAERMRERRSTSAPDAAQSTSPAPPQPTVLPAVIGIVVIGVAVLVLGFWVDARRNAEGVGGETAPLPQITLVEPAPGAVVASPIPVIFEVPVRLRWVAGGWQAGRLHIHAGVNGRELMPGSRDIEPLGQNRYRWTLPALPAGEHTLRLFWSGPDHRPIEAGASESITVQAR